MTNRILEQIESAHLKKDIPQFDVGAVPPIGPMLVGATVVVSGDALQLIDAAYALGFAAGRLEGAAEAIRRPAWARHARRQASPPLRASASWPSIASHSQQSRVRPCY